MLFKYIYVNLLNDSLNLLSQFINILNNFSTNTAMKKLHIYKGNINVQGAV